MDREGRTTVTHVHKCPNHHTDTPLPTPRDPVAVTSPVPTVTASSLTNHTKLVASSLLYPRGL
jgi:hypothetical protein